jgi:hypothetical protein
MTNDAKSMTINPLSIFYRSLDRWQIHPSGSIQISWKCDPKAVLAVCQAGNLDLAGVSRSNLDSVDTYFDRLLIVEGLEETQSSQILMAKIVDNLYRSALIQSSLDSNNCWFNWIGAMTAKAACHIWRKIPSAQQSPELFERLVTPTLSVRDLLAGFDPQYQPDLFIGLQGWTYRVVRYHIYTSLRANGHPYFGLSNLGIVARSSYKQMRMALVANIVPAQLELDISICKVFKSYLERSKIGANKLGLTDWQEILAAVQAISLAEPLQRRIDLTIAELGSRIDRVGSLIRAAASPVVHSYDDRSRAISIDRYASLPAPDIDESPQVSGQLFTIIDRFIHDLPAEAQKIVVLYHHQHLKQKEVAALIAQDRFALAKSKDCEISRAWTELSPAEITKLTNNYQTKVSRKLGDIYIALLDNIYDRISHPEGKTADRNSLAIEAVKQLLEQYFRSSNFSKDT